MTNSSPWKITIKIIGTPSISIRAMASMAMLNNQRVNPFKGNRNSRSKVEIY
jgi:hypothetical protein